MITNEMLERYYQLNKEKKEIEKQLEELKEVINHYFDTSVGPDSKGEVTINDYKVQRQVRMIEKFEQEETVKRLEKLNFTDLIQKKPDEKKIKSAISLGLLSEEDLQGCKHVSQTKVIYVKPLK